MLTERIDLYKYFGLKKPAGADGTLITYIHSVSLEMEGDSRLRPAMLVLPGGAYCFVSDRESEPVALTYFSHGFNCFVLNYSIAPVSHPVQLREGAMAMIFIRENAKKYHIDPEHVAAIGFSAGAHLCGMLGTLFSDEELHDLRNYDFVRPTAVLLCYPVSVYGESSVSHRGSFVNLTAGNEELSEKLSLEKCVNEHSSPIFLWHTSEDHDVPVKGTLMLCAAYCDYNVPYELHVFEKGVHGLSLSAPETGTVVEADRIWVPLSLTWLSGRGFKIYS